MVLFSPVHGAIQPRELAEWIIADKLACALPDAAAQAAVERRSPATEAPVQERTQCAIQPCDTKSFSRAISTPAKVFRAPAILPVASFGR